MCDKQPIPNSIPNGFQYALQAQSNKTRKYQKPKDWRRCQKRRGQTWREIKIFQNICDDFRLYTSYPYILWMILFFFLYLYPFFWYLLLLLSSGGIGVVGNLFWIFHLCPFSAKSMINYFMGTLNNNKKS